MELKKLTLAQRDAIGVLIRFGKVHAFLWNNMSGCDECSFWSQNGDLLKRGLAHEVFEELQPHTIPTLTFIALAKKRIIRARVCFDRERNADFFEATPTKLGKTLMAQMSTDKTDSRKG